MKGYVNILTPASLQQGKKIKNPHLSLRNNDPKGLFKFFCSGKVLSPIRNRNIVLIFFLVEVAPSPII